MKMPSPIRKHVPSHKAPKMTNYQLHWERKYQKFLIKFLAEHETFDGSEVSAWMRKKGLHDPENHNTWGTQIIYYAARVGCINSAGASRL
jgi:hypothetical protein